MSVFASAGLISASDTPCSEIQNQNQKGEHQRENTQNDG